MKLPIRPPARLPSQTSRRIIRVFGVLGVSYLAAAGMAAGACFWVDPKWQLVVGVCGPLGGALLGTRWIMKKELPWLDMGEHAVEVAHRYMKLHEKNMKQLELQEIRMARQISALSMQFEEEKDLLLQIREEREVEIKMLGYLKGLEQRPKVQAYVDDPSLRLRLLPGVPEEVDLERDEEAS